MVRIGNVTLGDRPRVVVAMRDDQDRTAMEQALEAGADIIELRLDSFSDTTGEYCTSFLKPLEGLPVLATVRATHEGGDWKGTEEARLRLFRDVAPLVDAIDIELSSTAIRDEVIAAGKQHGCTVLGSFHNFDRTPDLPTLRHVLQQGQGAGVHITKIAAKCNDSNDLRRLGALCALAETQPVVVIGMGSQSMLSRVFFPALGSLLTYTFLGEPTAPGQLNLPDMISALRSYYPQSV